MKKRYFLPLCAVLGAAVAGQAETLSPQAALGRLNEPGVRYSAPGGPLKLKATAELNGLPTYYTFANSQKTVFVSADDVAVPLLGEVDNPNLTEADMPPAMIYWLGEYSRQIAWAAERQANTTSTFGKMRLTNPTAVLLNEADAKKGTLATASRQNVGPLVATRWNQDSPYNLLCPKLNNRVTYTGCVATAMAQAMKYHNWPEKGSGSITYEWTGGNQELSMDFSTVTFDWANMLNTYTSSATQAQRNAVATLMQACGYSVEMNYGTSSSGAYTIALAQSLLEYFNYGNTVCQDMPDYHSQAEWEEMVYQNLVTYGPLIYNGVTANNEGHSFICDGYDTTDDLFHINWGWGGTADGYFKLNALDPDNQGIGGAASGEGFKYGQDAVFGIQKPSGNSVAATPWFGIEGSLTATSTGTQLKFTATGGGFYNMSGLTGSFSVRVQAVNTATNAVYNTSAIVTDHEFTPGYGFGAITSSLPANLPDGSYRVYLQQSVNGGDWSNFRAKYEYPDCVTVTVKDGEITVDVAGADALEATGYTSSTGFVAGKACSVDVTIKNTGSETVTLPLYALLGYEGSDNQLHLGANIGTSNVSIEAGETKTVTFSGMLSSQLQAGDYYLIIGYEDGDYIRFIHDVTDDWMVTVTSEGTIKVNSLTFTNPVSYLASTVTVRASITSTYKQQVTADLACYVCEYTTNGFSVIAPVKTMTRAFKANETANVTFVGTGKPLQEIAPGDYYYVIAAGSSVLAYKEVKIIDPAGVEDVRAEDADAPAEYFNLQGVRLANPQGLVIKVQGGKATKVIM